MMMTRIAVAVFAILIATACSKDSAKTADTMVVAADTTIAPAAATVTAPPSAESISGKMNPNTITDVELAAAGVPSDVAAKVASGRPYANMVAVDKVLAPTLSKTQRDSVYTRVWIPIDLNTATDAEILLIPGVGSRMLREFKEYRPWTSAAQFQREIGKYVDKAEVARLEKYSTLK